MHLSFDDFVNENRAEQEWKKKSSKIKKEVKKKGDVYHLVSLKKYPLSTQLQAITGDTYNAVDFKNKEDDKLGADPGTIIVHKKSGEQFMLPESVQESINEATTPNKKMNSKLVKTLKNEDDWGYEAGDRVYAKGGYAVYLDSFYYGERDAMERIQKSWKPGGDMHKYFLEEEGMDVEIVDTFSETNARGRHKKFTTDGVVGVVLNVK